MLFEKAITSPEIIIKASSQIKEFGPEGLLNNIQPGWHAQKNPHYPQTINITFKDEKTLSKILLYPQDNHPNRAPNKIRINYMKNNKTWVKGDIYNSACLNPDNSNSDYTKIIFNTPIKTQQIQLEIINNCGDIEFLTLKGIKIVEDM